MTSTSRSLQNSWNTAWATAPPSACQTLRNLNNQIAWGQSCVFAEENSDPTPFSINTACMPWVTSNIYPSPSAFYSPATACPDSWTAVATQTSGGDWIKGETALQCCPGGFDSDGGSGCRPGSGESWPVVECGEADAEENKMRTYVGVSWPAGVTASVGALQLRYQGSDVRSVNPTDSSPAETGRSGSGSESGEGGGEGGLSTGTIAGIAIAITLVLIIGALAAFLLWRRRKHRKTALLASKGPGGEKAGRGASGSVQSTAHHSIAKAPIEVTAAGTGRVQYETPEWNVEMDATEAERQKLVTAYHTPISASTADSGTKAAELGGMARVARKPIAPVEIDSTPVIPEVGDAYIPYRPGAER
ncbi:hypothetical protein EJ02DRAFT_455663 [Clathrospora elynae]|uniref:Uncharacterized protein n=1 Tax=Clathrospora elynae TaxID=706981 RepID=A0A6A5SJM5_9PLEO|nr:hypothetical protein EJ02DRAFT_455663 [Clathrospora elynae]